MGYREHQSSNRTYDGVPELTRLTDVSRQEIEWIWPGRLPAGKIVMLAGDPGLGKSFLTMDIAARLSCGAPFPDEPGGLDEHQPSTIDQHPYVTPKDVIILSAEDDPGDTIRPRLEDAGANLAHIHIMTGVRFGENAGPVRLDRDCAAIWRALKIFERPGLVIIDPITAYLGDTDANSNADVRRVLHTLQRLAEATRVCILCVSHLNKSSQNKAQYRTMGSLAFTAAARMAWLVAKDPAQPDARMLAPIKSNISGTVPGLRYKIVQHEDRYGPTVEYHVDPRPIALDDVEASQEHQPGELDEAITWLRGMLEDGAQPAKSVLSAARDIGISERTLKRAKRELGIRSQRTSSDNTGGGQWCWSLG